MFSKKQELPHEGRVDTLIGKETDLQGVLEAAGTVRIDGRFEGEIKIKGDLLVGEGSVIKANVSARNVVLAGYVKGNITCEGRLEITASGKQYGDVKVQNLVVNEGAIFRGNCEMTGAAENSLANIQVPESTTGKKKQK